MSVSDSQVITDAEAAQTSYNESVPESLSIADVETAVARSWATSLSRLLLQKHRWLVLIMTITETMAIAEGTTVGTYYQEFLRESATITDTNGGAANYQVSRTETATISETNGGRYLWKLLMTENANWQISAIRKHRAGLLLIQRNRPVGHKFLT